MTQALTLAEMGRRTTLQARLASAATEMVVNGLEADTLYDGACVVAAAADGGFGWQSRFTSGGAWDTGWSDYANQIGIASGATASASAGSNNYGPMATKDVGTPQLPVVVTFKLYTGNASRRAVMIATAAYVTTDGVSAVAANLMSQRVTNGAIADIRFISTTTNGLAAGSRVFLQRLG